MLAQAVWHTHRVDGDKRSDLTAYWWIEVEANDVLADADKLHICNHDNLPPKLALAWEQFELFWGGDVVIKLIVFIRTLSISENWYGLL